MFSLFSLRRLIVPLLLLVCAAVFRERMLAVEPYYRQLINGLPYLALGSALALSAYYNNSRLFTAALTLLVAYWMIDTQLQVALAAARPSFIHAMLSVSLPSVLLLLLWLPERGMFNRYGLLQAAVVPLLSVIAVWLYASPAAITAVNRLLSPLPFKGYYLSVYASGLFALAFLGGLFVLCRRDCEHAAALLAALLFGFVTLAFFKVERISTVMFTAAGIAVIVSLVRNSHDMAFRDELTGLRGRRALNERLKGLGRRYVIAMMDVDHFKKFNDTYGHDTGDNVLKMVATKISEVRGGGTAYRYGGEEFCIVFPGKRLKSCQPYLESVRSAVAGYKLALRNLQKRPKSVKAGRRRRGGERDAECVAVTISIGAAERDGRNESPDDVLKAADAALYKAKRQGRNRLVY
ncbi:MAG TPA: GGDEF domain-containing protein [Gammaproteobacteria bacterium]